MWFVRVCVVCVCVVCVCVVCVYVCGMCVCVWYVCVWGMCVCVCVCVCAVCVCMFFPPCEFLCSDITKLCTNIILVRYTKFVLFNCVNPAVTAQWTCMD